MVSKIIPPKSPPSKIPRNPSHSRHHNHHHRRRHHHHKSSLTNNNLVSSLNKSISSFYRRFLKLFQTPKTHPTSNNFFHFLFFPKNVNSIPVPTVPTAPINTAISRSRRSQSLLPPIKTHHHTTIILDLDETLVHSSHNPSPHQPFDFIIHPIIDEEVTSYHVLKRPYLQQFLNKLASTTQFEIVVFTAALKEYASLVLDEIDTNGVISHKLYRDSCKEIDGKLVKDLSELGRDLRRVVIVDDNPNAYAFQPENAIPVRPFVEDLEDVELMKMMRFFDECLKFGDMRDAVKEFLDDEERKLMKKLGLWS